MKLFNNKIKWQRLLVNITVVVVVIVAIFFSVKNSINEYNLSEFINAINSFSDIPNESDIIKSNKISNNDLIDAINKCNNGGLNIVSNSTISYEKYNSLNSEISSNISFSGNEIGAISNAILLQQESGKVEFIEVNISTNAQGKYELYMVCKLFLGEDLNEFVDTDNNIEYIYICSKSDIKTLDGKLVIENTSYKINKLSYSESLSIIDVLKENDFNIGIVQTEFLNIVNNIALKSKSNVIISNNELSYTCI